MVNEATNYVKKCFGGGEEDAIIFCGSGSTAAIKRLREVMGIVVPSILRERVLNFLSGEKRWVVFIGPYEHHSNILSWRQSLAEVVEIGLDGRTGSVDMEDLRQKLELYKSKNRPLLGHLIRGEHRRKGRRRNPPIIQKIREALAFRIKEWVGPKHIEWFEEIYIRRALKRLPPNPNICVLGNTTSKRQAILSFLIYSTTHSEDKMVLRRDKKTGLDLWGVTRGKPLHGPFVAKLLNDIFGIQARGGCVFAGPYGHRLLNIDESHSFGIRSLIKKGYVGIKPGWTRVSLTYYMPQEEFEFILASIEFLSVYGQRFLPLYHFNWRTGTKVFKKKTLSINNTGSASSFASLIKSLNLESNKEQIIMKDDVIHRYTSYLEAARHIANLLPKFPPQRSIPEGIDVHFVPCRF